MTLPVQIELRNNPNLSRFIRENSYLYKNLNRDGSVISLIERQMKEKYKLTTEDRLSDIGRKIQMVNEFMKVLN